MRFVRGRFELRVDRIPRPFPKSVHAVTLWPVIVYESQVWDSAAVQAHERYHWQDQIRWLLLPWFAAYLILLPIYGGREGHPLEREAYRRQRETAAPSTSSGHT